MAYEVATRNAVTAYFNTRTRAEEAVKELEQSGFTHAQISLAVRPEYSDADATHPGYAAGHAVGEKTAGVWGSIVNFFEGKSHEGAQATTGSGTSDDSIGKERVNGGYDYNYDEFQGSLNKLNVSEDHARYFGHHFSQGEEGAIVTVSAPGREEDAETILEKHKGDLGRSAAGFNYPSSETRTTATDRGTQRIQLLGEILRVHKDRVQRGDVVLRKNVVTENQTFEVPIEREELVITRSPVNGERSAPAGGTIGDDREVRIPLTEERVHVSKEKVVLEEVSVGKRSVTDSQSVTDSVRHEELSVEEERAERGTHSL